jgi:tetratricopeptide (TPR) repeat protein
MPKSLQPRAGGHPKGTPAKRAILPREIEDDVRRSARPAQQADVLSRLARAIDRLERDDPHGAVPEAERAKALAPRSASCREVLGMAYYGLGRWHDAVTELKAYKRITGRTDQNHLIADCYRALGRPEEAVPLADEVLRDRGASNEAKAEAVIVAASALADRERYAEALALLARAKTRDDVAADYTLRLWYVRGDILGRAGRPDEAAGEFRKIMRHDPSAFDVAERLAALG